MARWTSRGMDKFLWEEFGLDPINDPRGKFVNDGADIYRVSLAENKFRAWKYNLEENLPWELMASAECDEVFQSNGVFVYDACLYDGEIFVFLKRYARVNERYIPIYSIRKNVWILPSSDDFDPNFDTPNEDDFYQKDFTVGNCYFTLSLDWNQFCAEMKERYGEDQPFVPSAHNVQLRVYSFSKRQWDWLDTSLGIEFTKSSFNIMMYYGVMRGKTMREPSGKSALIFSYLTDSLPLIRLDLTSNDWSMVQTTGDRPRSCQACITTDSHIFTYSTSPGSEMKYIFCFDPELRHWSEISSIERTPQKTFPTMLYVDGKILLIGGNSDQQIPTESFYSRMEYSLGCYCWQCQERRLTWDFKNREEEKFKEEVKEKVKELRAQDEVIPALPVIDDLVVAVHNDSDRLVISSRYNEWCRKFNPPMPHDHEGLHVLDLNPKLTTLAMMTIVDNEVDASSFPKSIHLNLNTMFVTLPRGRGTKGARELGEEERKMLLFGKGVFRRALQEDLANRGLTNGTLYYRFVLQRILERYQPRTVPEAQDDEDQAPV